MIKIFLTNAAGIVKVFHRLHVRLQLIAIMANINPLVFHYLLVMKENERKHRKLKTAVWFKKNITNLTFIFSFWIFSVYAPWIYSTKCAINLSSPPASSAWWGWGPGSGEGFPRSPLTCRRARDISPSKHALSAPEHNTHPETISLNYRCTKTSTKKNNNTIKWKFIVFQNCTWCDPAAVNGLNVERTEIKSYL